MSINFQKNFLRFYIFFEKSKFWGILHFPTDDRLMSAFVQIQQKIPQYFYESFSISLKNALKKRLLTEIDGFHGNTRSILAVSFLVQLDHFGAVMRLGRMHGVEFTGVCSQLFHSSSTECITRSDQYTKIVLHKPKRDLQNDISRLED